MIKISRKIDIDVEMSPEDIADCFCELHDDGQALFFNRIAEVVATWGNPFCFQLQSIADNKVLTGDGRKIMRQIGEYGQEDI